MYFSKRLEQARVRVRSTDQPLDLILFDDAQQTVLRGYGALEGNVPVGLYWLQIRSGAEVARRILRVPPEGVDERVALPVRTVAPLPGSQDDDPAQRDAVTVLSNSCSAALRGDQAGLVVFLRGSDAAQQVELWGPEGAVPLVWEQGPGFSGGWAVLPEGGFRLRTSRGDDRAPTDVGVWLTRKRVHLWFAPVTGGHANGAAASWHTHRPHASWLLDEDHPEIRLHVEQALAAVRIEDAAPSEAMVRALEQYKMFDPMLGILAAALRVKQASELLHQDVDAARAALKDVAFVLERIGPMVPNHPDVLALRHVASSIDDVLEDGDGRPKPSLQPLAFPPMLAMLYVTLRDSNQPEGRTLIPGEIGERISGELTSLGPWTAWNPLTEDPYADLTQTQSMVDDYVDLVGRIQFERSGKFVAPEAIAKATGLTEGQVGRALQSRFSLASTMPDGPFDLEAVRALIEAEEIDDATVEAFVAWAEANPDEYQHLGQQILADDDVIDKAAPSPIDPDAHVDALQETLDRLSIPGPLFAPSSLHGIKAALVDAHAMGRRLRAVGSCRSLSDVSLPQLAHDHFVVALSRLDGVVADAAHNEAYVEAGCTIGTLNVALDQAGLALPNMGSGDFQTIAGLMSTGSHGSAYGIGDISALVLALELATVDASGQAVLYRFVRPGAIVHHPGYDGDALPVVLRDDPDEFFAAIVSLGCLGIVTAVTLRVEPTYFLREDRILSTWQNLGQTFLTAAKVPRHYELLFTPYRNVPKPVQVTTRSVTKRANTVIRALGLELAARNIGRKTARKRLNAALIDPSKVPRQIRQSVTCSQVSDYRRKSFRVLKLGLQVDATALEVAVPIDRAMAAADDLRSLIRGRMDHWTGGDPVDFWRHHAVTTSPISMRLAARSAGLLSMQHASDDQLDGDPWCMFEMPMLLDATRDDAAYQAYVEGKDLLLAEIETLLRDKYGGRPHWGLQFTATEPQLEGLWGDAWTRWKAVRRRLNPHGIFDSRFTDRLGLS